MCWTVSMSTALNYTDYGHSLLGYHSTRLTDNGVFLICNLLLCLIGEALLLVGSNGHRSLAYDAGSRPHFVGDDHSPRARAVSKGLNRKNGSNPSGQTNCHNYYKVACMRNAAGLDIHHE
jgi:hypothetical protein